MDRKQIIIAIEECAQRTGLAPATITGRAVNNSRLYKRMSDGGDCTTEIGKKLLEYISGIDPTNQQGAV